MPFPRVGEDQNSPSPESEYLTNGLHSENQKQGRSRPREGEKGMGSWNTERKRGSQEIGSGFACLCPGADLKGTGILSEFLPTTWDSLPITVSRQVRCGEKVDQGQ